MDTILKVDNLWGGYGRELVIKGVSFAIKRGEFLGIIGPNGSGKSTLLRLMSRVLTPQRGGVTFENKDITQMHLKDFCQKVSFVPQDTLINFSFTVQEIVLLGRIPHLKRMQMEGPRDYAVSEDALFLTDALHLKNRQIDELSAGERQRVIVAKALAQEPVLLFLDEPTAHLDIAHQLQILNLLKKLNLKNNLTIVVVLHDLNLAAEFCSRIILLNEGEVFKEGSPTEVLTYQNIERVYKTLVLVNKNPLSSKPYVVLVSERDKCPRD